MENWSHSLKVEAIHSEKIPTRAYAKNHVLEYIDVYYNRKQLHSKLGYRARKCLKPVKSLSEVSGKRKQDQSESLRIGFIAAAIFDYQSKALAAMIPSYTQRLMHSLGIQT